MAIVADKIAASAITAGKIAAGELKTSNYAEDANGNPTAGAKLDHQGTALKVAPGNLQIGSFTLLGMIKWHTGLRLNSAATSIGATFAAEPDTNYMVIVTPVGKSGAPVADAYIVTQITKGATSCTVYFRAAPGGTAYVDYEIMRVRAP